MADKNKSIKLSCRRCNKITSKNCFRK